MSLRGDTGSHHSDHISWNESKRTFVFTLRLNIFYFSIFFNSSEQLNNLSSFWPSKNFIILFSEWKAYSFVCFRINIGRSGNGCSKFCMCLYFNCCWIYGEKMLSFAFEKVKFSWMSKVFTCYGWRRCTSSWECMLHEAVRSE